jgi:hypothetical protein
VHVRVGRVDQPREIRVTVYLDPRAEPVRGTIEVDGSERRPFQGWIELAHAIDSARIEYED